MSGVLGVLGGSGLYDVEDLEDVEERHVSTPFGAPSDAILSGRVKGTDRQVLFLPRHGRGHRIPPSAINYRANLCALKLLGATAVLSVSAVGSMRESIAPGDVVIVDQFIDLTKRRISTFFDDRIAAHVSFADPVCPILASALFEVACGVLPAEGGPGVHDGAALGGAELRPKPRVHRGGTYVCIEGPHFSTRAESRVYRSWNVDVIGMTNMPEAKLAREAELPFATLALSTDYDCWHETEEAVNVDAVVATLRRNVTYAKKIALALAWALPDLSASPARNALRGAIMTAKPAIPDDIRSQLDWLIGRYLG